MAHLSNSLRAALQAGDTVQVRFEANQDGFLSVLGSGSAADRGHPCFAVDALHHCADRTWHGPVDGSILASAADGRCDSHSSNFLETPGNAGDRATYVVLSNPGGIRWCLRFRCGKGTAVRRVQEPSRHQRSVELLHPAKSGCRLRGAALPGESIEGYRCRPPTLRRCPAPPAPRAARLPGMAAARAATIGFPAAIASSSTMPKPSCTLGRQKTSARLYSATSWRAGHIAEPVTVPSRFSSRASCVQHRSARTVADDPDFEIGNAAAQRRGGAQQHVHALAAVEAADEEDREARRRLAGCRPAGAATRPDRSVRERSPGIARQPVELPRALGGITAGDQHTGGAVDVQPLAARLHRHGQPGQAALEADLVGDHAL